MYAAELGDYKTVEYLISKGVNPDSIDKVIVNYLDSKLTKKIFSMEEQRLFLPVKMIILSLWKSY